MSTFTRVAVVQMRHHPAFKNVLGDPLPDNQRETSSLLPIGMQAAPEVVREKFTELRRRVRAVYAEHAQRRVIAILDACKQQAAKLVVFPEYAIPPEILEVIAKSAPEMVVVAGSHYVDKHAVRLRQTKPQFPH